MTDMNMTYVTKSIYSFLLLYIFSCGLCAASETYKLNESFVQTIVEHKANGERYDQKRNIVSSGTYIADKRNVRIAGWSYDVSPFVIKYDKTVITKVAGMDVTLRVHRWKNVGLDLYFDWGSFKSRRQVVKISKKSCSDQVDFALKPGHEFLEVMDRKGGLITFATGMALVNYTCVINR